MPGPLRFSSLRSRAEHARVNRQLPALFRAAGARRARVRLQEATVDTLILADHDVWLAAHELPNRYRNAFGVGDPTARRLPWPSIQLNLAFEPGGARPQARFMRDAEGQIWVGHTGTLGGRVPGISREGFLAFLAGARDVLLDDVPATLLLLGTFADPAALLQRIVHLTHAADTYRAAAAAGATLVPV